MENIYYSPEFYHLQIFTEIDTAGCYEFNIFVVFRDILSNKLYWATDSGCSCPTPFESISINHLYENEITLDSFHSFDEALKNHSYISSNDYCEMKQLVQKHIGSTKSYGE